MCGFIAILGKDPTFAERWDKNRLLDSIAHRGPDAAGKWQEGGVYVGHRRLSIIDLATGDQPMESWDGRYVIAFNGEIYNFPELRELLRSKGARFKTQSDTEVILEAYRQWGPAAVERMHGMFAFVIWDRHERSAFGARDRIGIKPLCWSAIPGALILASTLEPFSLTKAFCEIDFESVRDLMVYDYILAPRTIFKNVHKFEPGSRFQWRLDQKEPTIERYWSPALAGDGGDEVFGGYPKYLYGENGHFRLPFSSWLPPLLRKITWRPRGMGSIYWRALEPYEQIQYGWVHYGDFPVFRKDLRQLIRPAYHEAAKIEDYFKPWEMRSRRYGNGFDVDVVMRADLETYLSENCLVKTDRASMLASLEVRVPYLDELILDRILPLPAASRMADGRLKALLMPIARRLLPREVWDRPKHGFDVPVGIRLAGQWKPAVEAALDWGESHLDLFDYRYLRRLHAINLRERAIGIELWNPFVFLAWSMVHSIKL